MKRIYLIACASRKKDKAAVVSELYDSSLFKLSLAYAAACKPDAIHILSAKYGLLNLNQKIPPYNLTLNKMSAAARKHWAHLILEQIAERYDLRKDRFIFLAGQHYRQYLVPYLSFYEVPMEGLRIGEQLRYLKESTT